MTPQDDITAICTMLEAFISGSDRSLAAAGRIEVTLDDAFPDHDEIQNYVTCFASYRPGGGDSLYDADQMVTKCKELVRILQNLPEADSRA
jgi:hypothetical protein